MAIFEWRKFNFFDLRKNVDDKKIADVLKDASITSTTSGNNQIIICDSFGFVHLFTKNWDVTSFKAHDSSIPLCALSNQHNLLVTIGNEDNGTVPVYKVWNLTKASKGGGLLCLRTVKIVLQKPTTLAVSENGQYLAIGFDRGSISVYRGDICKDRSKSHKTLSAGISPITGIEFKQYGKICQMYICSDSGVLVYNLQNKDKEIKTTLDKTCAPARCCAMQTSSTLNDSHFMVGRDDAVYCYTIDGRGPCYALDGYKSIIQWFRTHLITVAKPTKNTMSSQKDSVLTVIDILNKFIVFSAPIDATAAIIVEFGTCFIITMDKLVFQLDEKDLQNKLSLLFKKNLYDIAVRIAKSNQYDSEGLADIFKQYGDHLYSKGDFAGAVDQYVKTIGFLEPSYIVKRFLDSRHIQYLTDYLQALHKQSFATADHTTLLLNCFTRLDQTDKLKDFLRNDENPDIMFDLDVAIKVCRNASVEHALSLAKRNMKHDSCISILTEDLHLYADALDYISNLSFDDAEMMIKKYGILLMENSPNETTELLKRLCTNYRSKSRNSNIDNDLLDLNAPAIIRSNPEDFIHLFVKSPERLIDFLEHLVLNLTTCSQSVYNTLIEHYLHRWKIDKRANTRLIEILQNNSDSYDRNHVLILCSSYQYWPGVMLIYEEQKLYHLIVRHYLKNRDYNNLLSSCKQLGPSQPSLWLQALTGLRNDKAAPANMLSQILQVIAQEKLQSPLQILKCLAVENGPNLSSVREYFLQVFQRENDSTKQEKEFVEKYRQDSIALKKHIKHLQDEPIEFRGTVCDTCHQPLSMPALYFLCQHSYHQDCVRGYSDNDKDCPMCHSKNMQLIDALRAQSESRDQHGIFHDLLDRSTEPFSLVAEYFCRGLFNKIVIVAEDDMSQEINQNIEGYSTKADVSANKQSEIAHHSTYGPGAEAKLRLTEIHSSQSNQINKIPEGRMRAQESNKFSSSLEANISFVDRRSGGGGGTKITPSGSPKTHKTINNDLASTNPFDDDSYDEKKNPFAEVAEIEETKSKEYDNNLNPFE